ncbi:MAG: adenylyltransferase/cytidyltransferase family protein, partial [Patescibacteria group bacterium]
MKGARAKIKTLKEIVRIAAHARARGLRVVTTNGCFDILHVGHVRNLEKAKSFGNLLIVWVNSDSSTRANKGRGKPIIPERERAEMIASL